MIGAIKKWLRREDPLVAPEVIELREAATEMREIAADLRDTQTRLARAAAKLERLETTTDA